MLIKNGPNAAEFAAIVSQVSVNHYDGNLTTTGDEYTSGSRVVTVNRARVRAVESGFVTAPRDTDYIAPGARKSWSGRRTTAACWHAYRDVLALLFKRYPNAAVITAMARYTHRDGFYQHYPSTAYKNIGSMMQPTYMTELCDCRHSNPYENDETTTTAHPQTDAINAEFGWDDSHSLRHDSIVDNWTGERINA